MVTEEPPLFSEAGVQGYCVSLNTPVVRVEALPLGPARAAIVLFAEDYGTVRLAVAVRSLQAGQVAVYLHGGDLNEFSTPGSALETGLNFAEAMGFLFDEDVVARDGDAGCTWAMQDWQALLGMAASADPDSDSVLEFDDEEGELLLEEVATPPKRPATSASPPPAAEPASAAEPTPPAAEGSRLTKFRRGREKGASRLPPRAPDPPARRGTAQGTSGPGSSARGSELGRISIVRRRLGGDAPPRPGWLARLLSSF